MLLIIDLGFYSLIFYTDQNLDEDFIPGSSDEDSSDGSPSSNKCELKKGKEPKKITVVEKKRPATGN